MSKRTMWIITRGDTDYLVQRTAHSEQALMVVPRDWINGETPKYLDELPHVRVPSRLTYPRPEGQWNTDRAVEIAHGLLSGQEEA